MKAKLRYEISCYTHTNTQTHKHTNTNSHIYFTKLHMEKAKRAHTIVALQENDANGKLSSKSKKLKA